MIGETYKILIIDSDKEVRTTVGKALEAEGYKVFTSGNSKDAILLAKKEVPHLVITELVMPQMDGIEVCLELKQISQLSKTLIVFLTPRSEDYSQVAAFNAGADDYILKPVKPRVLVSRLKALLKRHYVNKQVVEIVHSAGITIDRERYLIYKDGESIVLPKKEFELLALLYSAPRKVFSRKEISMLIWGYEIFPKNRTLDVHIRKLREKLGDGYIKTVKGIGYSLEN